MQFASDVTLEEASRGFERARHLMMGTIVYARIGNGIRAVKMVADDGRVRYEICDDQGIVLYRAAESLFELETRFGLGERRAG